MTDYERRYKAGYKHLGMYCGKDVFLRSRKDGMPEDTCFYVVFDDGNRLVLKDTCVGYVRDGDVYLNENGRYEYGWSAPRNLEKISKNSSPVGKRVEVQTYDDACLISKKELDDMMNEILASLEADVMAEAFKVDF